MSSGNETTNSENEDVVIDGQGGNDSSYEYETQADPDGNNVLIGGSGGDYGNDTLYGGTGEETITVVLQSDEGTEDSSSTVGQSGSSEYDNII